MAKQKLASDAIVKELRAFGLAYPGASIKCPWPGHKDLAVNGKTFAYLTIEGEPFRISCKLPSSSDMALMLPFVKPTEYGLGMSGWVTAEFPDELPPVDLLKQWIDESYRAQAPKKLVAQLAPGPRPLSRHVPDIRTQLALGLVLEEPARKASAKKPAAKKPAPKKPAPKRK
ncbi:MAG: MmcQ/YjbR family DNA-binding protein [Deltaproteobacteria bacterium]